MSSSDMFATPVSPGAKVSMVGGSVDPADKSQGKMNGALAAAALALGSGFAAWALEQGGTFLIVEGFMKMTGTGSIRSLLEMLVSWAGASGWQGMLVTTGVATVLQLLPVCNGILLMMTLGSMFGTVQGVAIASVAATTSALMCLLTSRHVLRDMFVGKEPPLLKAVASSIAASDQKSLLIVLLFRLSPVVPYCLSNYLFGLTEVRILPYLAGTWMGTLPAISAFVSAGVLTKSIANGTASAPTELLVLGFVATVCVLTALGKISQQELNKMADAAGGEGGEVHGREEAVEDRAEADKWA